MKQQRKKKEGKKSSTITTTASNTHTQQAIAISLDEGVRVLDPCQGYQCECDMWVYRVGVYGCAWVEISTCVLSRTLTG